MDFGTYQHLAQRTSSTKEAAGKVLNGCLGLIGESGEVVDVVKKLTFQGMHSSVAEPKLTKEIGDVLWYCAQLCTGLNVDLDELMISDDAVIIMAASNYQNMSLTAAAVLLSGMCHDPYDNFCDDYPMSLQDMERKMCNVPRIISLCKYILEQFCCVTLQACMDANIAKLKERYPDGFDADRSNNRAPGDQ